MIQRSRPAWLSETVAVRPPGTPAGRGSSVWVAPSGGRLVFQGDVAFGLGFHHLHAAARLVGGIDATPAFQLLAVDTGCRRAGLIGAFDLQAGAPDLRHRLAAAAENRKKADRYQRQQANDQDGCRELIQNSVLENQQDVGLRPAG